MDEVKYLFPRKIDKNSLFLGYTFTELAIISVLALITAITSIMISWHFLLLGVPTIVVMFMFRRGVNESKNQFEVIVIRFNYFVSDNSCIDKIKGKEQNEDSRFDKRKGN